MLIRFKHFQTRLLVFFLVPLIVVLTAVYLAVAQANTRNALAIIETDLQQGLANFNASIRHQSDTLILASDLLTSDFAFVGAYKKTGDYPTRISAINNLLNNRLTSADFLVMVDMETGFIQADSLHLNLKDVRPPWYSQIEVALARYQRGEFPEASDFLVIDNKPYFLTIQPFYTPTLTDWVGLGFELNDDITNDLNDSVSAEITIMFMGSDGLWHINATTMPPATHAELTEQFNQRPASPLSNILSLSGEQYVTLAVPISSQDQTIEVVLQRSLAQQLAPFNSLRTRLLIIFGAGLVLLTFGVLFISRNVTRPMLQLAAGAKRIESGDYAQQLHLPQKDEIGELAHAFNSMARGLVEKEKVRDLLGKVVSPQIASELMSKDLELGGEDREITILFSDVRGFTSLCEGQSAQQTLSLLNEYFSAISAVIEQHGGVVDKYIGDAVMALFGAPVQLDNAAHSAVATALGMEHCLTLVNASFAQRGIAPIGMGIGVNTDQVVVGNMGSRSRLNYTAIGDGVNLASRLESLTKAYGAGTIVSASTMRAAPDFLYLPLDKVRVKGKRNAVEIYQPLLPRAQASPQLLETIAQFASALDQYYTGNFQAAQRQFTACAQVCKANGGPIQATLFTLYQLRLEQLLQAPPDTWDGVHTYVDK